MNDPHLTPKVCIDGNAIRQVREANKLTQLYVAKVVGVTTDTVSRWENNRYPSIRRDNALLLAEALEVNLADILLNGTGESTSTADQTVKKPSYKVLLPIFIALALVLFVYFYFLQRPPATYEFKATRILPAFAVPDGTMPVRVRLATSGDLKGMILREHFPQGWQLLQASPPPSSLDNVEGMVRWILKPGERPPVISYLMQVPADLTGRPDYEFTGEVIVNPRGSGVTYTVYGDKQVHAGPFHWADDNGDLVIDDSETLAAADSIDEMEKLHLSWETIEKIWDAGKYKWDAEQKKFIPVRGAATQ
jgi:transcriptional regulator with XRE-family HTH domain